jgi:hypothetical protein
MSENQWPQRRYYSANSSSRFSSLAAFLEKMAGSLTACCECDGRGCVVCISADAMREAATALQGFEAVPPERVSEGKE